MAPFNSDIDHLLELQIDAKRLSAGVKIERSDSSELVTIEALLAFLKRRDIHAPYILADEINALVEAVKNSPTHAHEMIVVRGVTPVQGIDAKFEFSDDIKDRIERVATRQVAYDHAEQNDTLGDEPQSEQAVDFYNQSPFILITKDQFLGTVTRATPGTPGIDISNQPIAPNPGKDLGGLLDGSVSIDEQGSVTSANDGHLVHTRSSIQICKTLEIHGRVDFKTGNIEFTNDVIIKEGVCDRFRINAKGNIEIFKLVEAAYVESAMSIVLHTGMAGRGSGAIHAGGDLSAVYLDDVQVTIAGDCKILREITNCTALITGAINSESATLRGGEVSIANSGTIGSIGSAQGVPTKIILGQIPEIEEKLSHATGLITQIHHSITKQTHDLDLYIANIGKPSADQTAQIDEFQAEIQVLKSKHKTLHEAITRLTQIRDEHTKIKLSVQSSIFAKTTIWVPGWRVYFENDVRGPLSVELDAINEPIIVRNSKKTPLNAIAKVVPDSRVLAMIQAPPIEDDQDQSNGQLDSAA